MSDRPRDRKFYRFLFLFFVAILTGALVVVGWPWYVALPVTWLAMLGLFRLQVSV